MGVCGRDARVMDQDACRVAPRTVLSGLRREMQAPLSLGLFCDGADRLCFVGAIGFFYAALRPLPGELNNFSQALPLTTAHPERPPLGDMQLNMGSTGSGQAQA